MLLQYLKTTLLSYTVPEMDTRCVHNVYTMNTHCIHV
jgi:hypothetical protein